MARANKHGHEVCRPAVWLTNREHLVETEAGCAGLANTFWLSYYIVYNIVVGTFHIYGSDV